MDQQSFGIGSKVTVVGRSGEWYIEEMVMPGDHIVTEKPFWLSQDGKKSGWIRAAESELTLCD